ncbi:hypothetical protein [Salinibacter ruber]|uniref:hypothetical protein n=1 Tax=Salinibacter ruber TaxID=146919 RepID=UPI000E594AEC|nr:hypothetical protein [Salinibacter ruber]
MARSATIILEAQTADARQELDRLGSDLEQVEVEAAEAGSGFERLSSQATTEMIEARQAAERMSTSMRSMSGASSTATDLTFELTQQIQDMQAAGIRGATNALPMMFEQFSRLQNQAGSTTGALSTMVGTFTGPTGILALGTLGLQALPAIVDFFGGIADSAREARDSVDDLKSAADGLIEGFAQDLPTFEITDRDQARGLQQGLQESIEGRRQLLEDLREAQGARGAQQAQLSAGAARFAGMSDQVIQSLIQKNRTQLNQERALEQVLSQKLSRRERAVQQQELLNAATEQGISLSKDEADAEEKKAQALSEQARSLEQIEQVQPAGTDPAATTPGAGPGPSPGPNFTDFELSGSNRELGRQMKNLEDQSNSAFSAVQLGAQAATSATNALAQSLARGESLARGLQGTFSQLLSQVGSTLLQQAITGGSALGLSGGSLGLLGAGAGLFGGIIDSYEEGAVVTP